MGGGTYGVSDYGPRLTLFQLDRAYAEVPAWRYRTESCGTERGGVRPHLPSLDQGRWG